MDHLQLALLVKDVSAKDQWLHHRLKPQCHPCKAEEQIQVRFSSQATTAKPGREDGASINSNTTWRLSYTDDDFHEQQLQVEQQNQEDVAMLLEL
jgi:hypothetical protein